MGALCLIRPGSLVEKCKDLAVQEQLQETFVLNLSESAVHCLGDIETLIWSKIDGGSTPEDLAQAVCDEYEVDRERARQDVIEFLQELEARGLVREKPAGG